MLGNKFKKRITVPIQFKLN